MAQEEKSLLLQDLCARVYYGVLFMAYDDEINEPVELLSINPKRDKPLEIDDGYDENSSTYCSLEDVKPYLRSLSSITEEEKKEAHRLFTVLYDRNDAICGIQINSFVQLDKVIEWLNKHHFDYRGLIPKGLALEALEGMYG